MTYTASMPTEGDTIDGDADQIIEWAKFHGLAFVEDLRQTLEPLTGRHFFPFYTARRHDGQPLSPAESQRFRNANSS